MNADTKGDVHPSFVELIKEMTPADAKILKIVLDASQTAFIVRLGSPNQFFTMATHYSFTVEGLTIQDIGKSLNNLERLGLLERRDEFPLSTVNDETENTLKNQYELQRAAMDIPQIKNNLKIPENGHVQVSIKRNGLYMNPLGESFARICL
jgi:hypothetical protein